MPPCAVWSDSQPAPLLPPLRGDALTVFLRLLHVSSITGSSQASSPAAPGLATETAQPPFESLRTLAGARPIVAANGSCPTATLAVMAFAAVSPMASAFTGSAKVTYAKRPLGCIAILDGLAPGGRGMISPSRFLLVSTTATPGPCHPVIGNGHVRRGLNRGDHDAVRVAPEGYDRVPY